MTEGVARYGKNFRNYETFTIKHLDRRTLLGCTPYHGADVFLTAHAAFQLEFERALRSVAPALAAPYWDYTVDDVAFGADWYAASPIFGETAEFYGPAAPRAGRAGANDADRARGPLAGVPVASQGALGFDCWPESNGWGRITEAFNTDPAANVPRAATTCGLATERACPAARRCARARRAHDRAPARRSSTRSTPSSTRRSARGRAACRAARRSRRALVAAHPAAAATVENVALNLNLPGGMFNNSRLNSAYPVLCPRGARAPRAPRPRAEHAGDALDAALAASRASARARTRGSTPSSPCNATAEYEVAYSALDVHVFILAKYASVGTRISDFLEQVDDDGADGADDASGASGGAAAEDRAADAAPDPSASTGRWRWLDAAGAALPVATDMALTTYVAKLVFHPARVAAYTGPLASPNDPLFWPSHATFERPWAYLRAGGSLADDDAAGAAAPFNDTWDFADADDAAADGGCWGYSLDARLPFSNLFGEDDDDVDDDAAGDDAAATSAAEHVAAVAAELRALVGDDSGAGGAGRRRPPPARLDARAGPGAGPSGGDVGVGASGGATTHRTYGEQRNAPVSAGGYTNRELLAALHPHNPTLSFVYADFAWDHCAGEERSTQR